MYGKNNYVLRYIYIDNHKDLFPSKESLLKLCVSNGTFHSGSPNQKQVKAEAINSGRDKKWSSFLCILALSSVTNRRIQTFYPEFGDYKYSSSLIHPRCFVSSAVAERLRHCSREQRVPSSSPVWTSVLR